MSRIIKLVQKANQRVADYLREQRILTLENEFLVFNHIGRYKEAREALELMNKEINERSASQVIRMEKERGLV